MALPRTSYPPKNEEIYNHRCTTMDAVCFGRLVPEVQVYTSSPSSNQNDYSHMYIVAIPIGIGEHVQGSIEDNHERMTIVSRAFRTSQFDSLFQVQAGSSQHHRLRSERSKGTAHIWYGTVQVGIDA